jgi:hypothetical protein
MFKEAYLSVDQWGQPVILHNARSEVGKFERIPNTAEDVWKEAERFLRKHGYMISKDKFTDFFPSWMWMVEREYLDEGKFREAVAFVIHECVECEELKRIVGYWIYPRDYDLKCLRLKDIMEYKKCMDKHMDAHLKAEEMEKLYLSTA